MVAPDPASVRADRDWPGEEMARTALPVVIGRAGAAGGRRLILSGHLDVVPPGDLATWTTGPWDGDLRDGRVYGRGACDMKGGVAAILAAVRALGASGDLARLAGELVVALVPSEEDGGQGTLAAIRAGVTGDLAIIPEPSNLDIVVAHAGAITFRLTVPGRAAHASQRREGVSALDKLFTLVRALEADETRRNAAETDPLMTVLGLPYPTIVGIVSGGEWASTVLDRVVADGRYGVRLGQTRRGCGSRAAGGASPPRAPRTTSCATIRPPSRSPAAGSGPRACRPTTRCRSGLAAVAEAVTGPSAGAARRAVRRRHADVRQRGRDAVCDLRPGDVKVAHSADEYVPARRGRGLRAGPRGVGPAGDRRRLITPSASAARRAE